MIITLCGSTKFKKEFEEVNKLLTLQGHIVISVGVFGHSDNIKFSEGQKEMLDKIHKDKINLSDAIYVINKDHYIGRSTKSEIDYANEHNKTIMYYERRFIMDKFKVYIETDIDYTEYEFDTLEEAEEFYNNTDETAGIILPDGTLI